MRYFLIALLGLVVADAGLAVSNYMVLIGEDPLWSEPPVFRMACTYWNGRAAKTYEVTWDKTPDFRDFDCAHLVAVSKLSGCAILPPGGHEITYDSGGKYRCAL